jgi:hypothetical protein
MPQQQEEEEDDIRIAAAAVLTTHLWSVKNVVLADLVVMVTSN